MPSLYTRNQGKTVRYYADLRDIGGKQMALVPPGKRQATTDEAEAYQLLAAAIKDLKDNPPLKPSAMAELVKAFIKKNPGKVTDRWLKETQFRLSRAVKFFGADRDLATIQPLDVRAWLDELQHLSESNQRHHVHALSSLYRYAHEQGHVQVGTNPVRGLFKAPSAVRAQRTDEYFEGPEAAKFLKAAKDLDLYYEVFATYLLTGGRRTEVLGLLIGDVDLDMGLLHIRPNRYRGLKRAWSERAVPLWPQLREILEPYLAKREGEPPDALLFPGLTGGMLTDLRSPLKKVAKKAKMPVPRITKFRHTYATTRLQTTDGEKQIAMWTVAKELGHKTVARVEGTYGHASHYRSRGEVVEYRVASPKS